MQIAYSQCSNEKEAYQKTSQVISSAFLAQFKIEAKVDKNDSDLKIKAEGRGFTLVASFLPGYCLVDLDLSFMLKPFRNKIMDKIEENLKKAL